MNERWEDMNSYFVDCIKDGRRIYYVIRWQEDLSIVKAPTKYLMHKIKANCSPNTVKRQAFSISYYLTFVDKAGMQLGEVWELPYDKQHAHFTEFLLWLQAGKHTSDKNKRDPTNSTCNCYLRDVFGWYQFMEMEEEQFGNLKVLSSHIVSFTNGVGIRFSVSRRTFRGYLQEDDHVGRTIEQEKIITLLENCSNVRDQLLLLLLAETGFRIGEMLGVYYTKDIDYQNRSIQVQFRSDNANGARAKNAEYRRAKISEETFEILTYYLSEYREVLKTSEYLFVTLRGVHAGNPLKSNTVYALMDRLKKKTGIKVTPHMLRHYFANERRKNGWDMLLISKALGHRHIATTEKYLDIGSEELVEASEEYYKNNHSLYMIDQLV